MRKTVSMNAPPYPLIDIEVLNILAGSSNTRHIREEIGGEMIPLVNAPCWFQKNRKLSIHPNQEVNYLNTFHY